MARKNDKSKAFSTEKRSDKVKAVDLMDLLISQGLIGDKRIADEEKRWEMQEKQRDRYHNTMLLLKHYRDIAWTVECFPDTKNVSDYAVQSIRLRLETAGVVTTDPMMS